MIAVDTNVIVRLLTRDDEEQFQKASTLFSKYDIFIPETVILETEWVLRYAYNFAPAAICDAFSKTFGLPNVKLQRPDIIAQAIDLSRKDLGFADSLHLSMSKECKHFATFDTAFIRKAKGLTKCRVKKP
ncbi:MAG: type II toxin-antitoxin system VapC family toxin [Desulfobacterales bacterium]|nr:type II toxin-antitoxin system VapC family toxin [Desulfobacterales bacterium]